MRDYKQVEIYVLVSCVLTIVTHRARGPPAHSLNIHSLYWTLRDGPDGMYNTNHESTYQLSFKKCTHQLLLDKWTLGTGCSQHTL